MIAEWTKDLDSYSKKYYVALKAREPGIFAKWPDCEAQTKGVAGWNGKTVCKYDQEAGSAQRGAVSSFGGLMLTNIPYR